MKISQIYKKHKPVFSCEVFPPKPEVDISTIFNTIKEIKEISPHFISVTYGAGGGTKKRTIQICSDIKNNYGLEPLMHLTCIDTKRQDIEKILVKAQKKNIHNILALRGDIPPSRKKGETAGDFEHANDLVEFIQGSPGDFCVGVAGYPEGHPESLDVSEDIRYLKKKTDAGAQFIISQLFFDNEYFYRFIDNIRSSGIDVPVSAGIMPVFKASLIKKMVSLCGATIPSKLNKLIEKYSDSAPDMIKAGIDYAREQTEDILSQNAADGIHLYTMNKSRLAKEIWQNLK